MPRDAYDVLDDLSRAGVHIIVVKGNRLQWRCNPDYPPVHGNVFLELKAFKADVIRILMDVPDGCAAPDVCESIGICPREIESSACHNAAAKPRQQRKDSAA